MTSNNTATSANTLGRKVSNGVSNRVDLEWMQWGTTIILAFIPATAQGDRMRSLLTQAEMEPCQDPGISPDLLIAPAVETALRHMEQLRLEFAASGVPPLTAVVTANPDLSPPFPVDIRLPWSARWFMQQLSFAVSHPVSIATTAEITTLRQELELIKAAIVHNISHELNTPLLQVKSAVDQIERALPEDDYVAQLADYAKQAVRRLESLVGRVVRIARGIDIHPEPTLATDSLSLALRQLRANADHRGSLERVQTQVAPQVPPVMADKQGLAILLELLIDNALKFSSAPVQVTIDRHAHGVRFAVVDAGIGISPDDHERIFTLFFQVDSGSTRRVNGAGIGLTIARQIADRHGTILEVDSALGQGSTFSFILPLASLGNEA